MPIALEPGGRWPVVLESDKDKEPKPTFYFKAPSVRDARNVARLSEVAEFENADKWFDAMVAAIKKQLVGWENMGPFDYDVDKVEELLTIEEAKELVQAMLSVGRVDPKNSESP